MAYNGPLPQGVKAGGSGASTLTGVLTGNGTSAFTASAVTQHDVLVGGASNAITSVAPSSTSGVPLISQGSSSDPVFGTAVVAGGGTGATTLTNHGVLLGQGTSAVVATAAGSAGQVLQSGGASADPAYSTATYPATATGTGKILRADGTNWVATTATYPDTAGTSGNVLTSDGTNWVSSAASGNVGGPGSSTDRAIATWNGTGGTALFNNSTVKIDSTGRQTNTTQPAFLVNLASNLSNKTGDGTVYTMVFDHTVFDQNSNITLSGTTFTAPVTGRYALQVGLFVSGMTSSDTDLRITLITTGSAGNVFFVRINPSSVNTAGFFSGGGSIIVPLSATQTAQVTLTVSGSTKTVGLLGGTDSECFFSGYLVC